MYIVSVKDIPTAEGMHAELSLLFGREKEAEETLISAGLIYRAIRLNLRLYNFKRYCDVRWSV